MEFIFIKIIFEVVKHFVLHNSYVSLIFNTDEVDSVCKSFDMEAVQAYT
jgi:hypothetical protein